MTQPLVSQIQRVVARTMQMSVNDLLRRTSERRYARPRQVAMYLAREMTDCSFPLIGEIFGGRDHTTVMHAHKAIGALIKEDRGVGMIIENMRDDIIKLAEGE